MHSEGGRRKREREKVQLTIIHQDLGSIVRVICFSFSQTFQMSSAINIAWGQRDAHGCTCPCGERLSILATPDTQSYQLHCQGKTHRAGISPVVKRHQLSMTRFFNNFHTHAQTY